MPSELDLKGVDCTKTAAASFDIMGGTSHFSGGLCLQHPTEMSLTCRISKSVSGRFEILSPDAQIPALSFSLDELPLLAKRDETESAVDCVIKSLAFLTGVFPEIKGIAGAIEIEGQLSACFGKKSQNDPLIAAVLKALNSFYQLDLRPRELALFAQQIFDVPPQILVSFLAENEQLFSICCQGNFETKAVTVPAGVEFWAINGGPLGYSSEEKYQDARTATFMGRKIISTYAPEALENEIGEKHLANLSADVWRSIRELIPDSISGAQFLEAYGPLEEADTTVEPEKIYRLRLATEHPIYENERTHKFVRFLELAHSNPNARYHFLSAAGELMIQSHFSYDHRHNLGNKESDLLVKLAREAGKTAGIYGAKLSGNGDSTTVAFLCDREVNPHLESAIQSLVAKYEVELKQKTVIFQGYKTRN